MSTLASDVCRYRRESYVRRNVRQYSETQTSAEEEGSAKITDKTNRNIEVKEFN